MMAVCTSRAPRLGAMVGVLASLALLGGLLAWGAEGDGAMIYYVSPAGDDTQPGTFQKPWRTITMAAAALSPGDTVHIREGTYREQVVPLRSGSATAYITYAAYPGEEVTIDGKGIALEGVAGLFEISDCECIRVSGLRVLHSTGTGIRVRNSAQVVVEHCHTYDTASSGVGVFGSREVTVHGNEVELAVNGAYHECITVAAGSERVRVTNNHVHNRHVGRGGGEGIDIKDGSSNVVVMGNHVHDIDKLGIYVDAWNKHTYNVEVIANVVHDCGGCGFAAASERAGLLENVRFVNNLAYRNMSAGIAVAGWNGGYEHPIHNVEIINNTVCQNGWKEHSWGGGIEVASAGARRILIRNNIVSDNRDWQIRDAVGSAEVTIDHNLIQGFQGAEDETRGESSIEGDARFVNAEAGDFHLQQGSPAVDAGSAEAGPKDDLEGAPRPAGRGWDLGAYELKGE